MKKNNHIPGKFIVIIPSIIPWEFTTDFVRQTALQLNRKKIITYIYRLDIKPKKWNNIYHRFIAKADSFLYLVHPFHLFPLERVSSVFKFNSRLFFICFYIYIKLKYGQFNILLWIQHPQHCWLGTLVKKLNPKNIILYDCVDYFLSDPNFNEILPEKQLVKQSDFVFANSNTLVKHLRKYRNDIHLTPQGFDINVFRQTGIKQRLMLPMMNNNVVGFTGGINRRLDFQLINSLILHHPDWHFVFCGPIQDILGGNIRLIEKYIDNFQKFPNFKYISYVPRQKIPALINQFDIAIIPYNSKFDFNKYCYPMKLFEYFYMGKPVVSTPIEELKRFPEFVKVGITEDEWKIYIKELLSKPWPKSYKQEQRKLALNNSWENKIKSISENISLNYD